MAKTKGKWINFDSTLANGANDTLTLNINDSGSSATTVWSSAKIISTIETTVDPKVFWKEPVNQQVNILKEAAGAPNGTGYATGEYCLNINDGKIYYFNGTSWDAGTSYTSTDRILFSKSSAGSTGTSETYIPDNDIYVNGSPVTTTEGWSVVDKRLDVALTLTSTGWIEFTGAGSIIAGNGLDKSEDDIYVKLDTTSGLQFDTNKLEVKLANEKIAVDGTSHGILLNEGEDFNFVGEFLRNSMEISTQLQVIEKFPLVAQDITNGYITLTHTSGVAVNTTSVSVVGFGKIVLGTYTGSPVDNVDMVLDTTTGRIYFDDTNCPNTLFKDTDALVADDVIIVEYKYTN